MTDNKNITPQKEEPDLYKRSIKGGYWVFASNILEIVKTLLIANLFRLEDLGLLSICYMLMALLKQFSESGFQNALIQKKDELTREHLDTTWVIGILRGVILFLILFAVAPAFVTLLNKTPLAEISPEKVPLAVAVIRVTGLCFLVGGFRNIGTIYFQKNLRFKKVFYLSAIGTFSDFVLTVILVLVFRSIWGVIISRVAAAIINCIFSYILSNYRPRFRISLSKAKELWTFGKWIYGQQILGYLMAEGDDFFVVFYLGLPSLALYRYAYRFANMPATHITYIISRITFPAYSKIQCDLLRLREAYLKVLQITALISFPVVFLILLLGPDFVHLLLPERMYPMIITLQILALKGLMGSLSATWVPLFRALGKPEKITHLMYFGIIILGVTIYPFTKLWGIAGTALATLSIGVIVNPYGHFLLCRTFQCRLLALIKPYLLPFISSVIMSLSIIVLKQCVLMHISYIRFFIFLATALAVYVISIYILDLIFDHGIRKLYIEQKNQLGGFLRRA